MSVCGLIVGWFDCRPGQIDRLRRNPCRTAPDGGGGGGAQVLSADTSLDHVWHSGALISPPSRHRTSSTMTDAPTANGPAHIVLPASGVAKCAKAGAPRMTFTHEAKSALHDAALVFVSFAASR